MTFMTKKLGPSSFNMNRSFVKRSKENEAAANLSLRSSSSPDRSFVRKSRSRSNSSKDTLPLLLTSKSPNTITSTQQQQKKQAQPSGNNSQPANSNKPKKQQNQQNRHYYHYPPNFNPYTPPPIVGNTGSSNPAAAALYHNVVNNNTTSSSSSGDEDNNRSRNNASQMVNITTASAADNSSFWNEWAEEVMKEEEEEKETAQFTTVFDNEPSISFFRLEQEQEKQEKEKQKDDEKMKTSTNQYSKDLLLGVRNEEEEEEEERQDSSYEKEEPEVRQAEEEAEASNYIDGNENDYVISTTTTTQEEKEVKAVRKLAEESKNNTNEISTTFQVVDQTFNTADVIDMSQSLFLEKENNTNTTNNRDTSSNTNTSTTDEKDLSLLAMEHSNQATEWLERSEYAKALEHYRQAADVYEQQVKTTGHVVAAVNAAGCFRNMAAVSRMLYRYDEAATYLQKAERLYICAREGVAVHQAKQQDVDPKDISVTLDGKRISAAEGEDFSEEDDFLCLDSMLLETLQFRAKFHIKYQNNNLAKAIECHELCLKELMHLHKIHNNEEESSIIPTVARIDGIAFTQLSHQEHTAMLVKSLEALGMYYRNQAAAAAAGKVEDKKETTAPSLVLFEDALDLLKGRQEMEEPENDDLIDSVAQVLRDLSEIYFRRQELDRAVTALHDSVCKTLTASGAPDPEAIATLNKMGNANEQMENYDQAMECYERVLFARSRYYGNTHVCVAKSLINVARVMELKDNGVPSEESSDLYSAANAIFRLQETPGKVDVGKDAKEILQSIPTVIRQGRYEKAIEDLHKCLDMTNDDSNINNGVSLDKAQIYFDLGRAYMGLNDFKTATEYLVESVKEAGHVSDEEVFTMLQRVEFLQQKGKQADNEQKDAVNDDEGVNKNNTAEYSIQRHVTHQDDATLSVVHDATPPHIFEDASACGAGCNDVVDPCRQQQEEEKNYNGALVEYQANPFHEILQQSFSIPAQKRSKRSSIRRRMRKRMKTLRNAMSPPRTQIHTKLAKNVAEKVRKMQKARSEASSSVPKRRGTKEKLPPKLKLLRHKWGLLRGQERKNIVSPEKSNTYGESVDYPEHSSSSRWARSTTLSELPFTAFPPLDPAVTSPLPGLRNVVIVEDEEAVEMAYRVI